MSSTLKYASPSDFSKFVYCPKKWIFSQTSYWKNGESNPNLTGGKMYEASCVKWVQQKYKTSTIVYNGTQNSRFKKEYIFGSNASKYGTSANTLDRLRSGQKK